MKTDPAQPPEAPRPSHWPLIEKAATLVMGLMLFALSFFLVRRFLAQGDWISLLSAAMAMLMTLLFAYAARRFVLRQSDEAAPAIFHYVFLKLFMLAFTGFYSLVSVLLAALALFKKDFAWAGLGVWVLTGGLCIASLVSRFQKMERTSAFQEADQRLRSAAWPAPSAPGRQPLKMIDLPWTLAGLALLIFAGLTLFLLFVSALIFRSFSMPPLLGALAVCPLILYPLNILLEMLEALLGRHLKPKFWIAVTAALTRLRKKVVAKLRAALGRIRSN